MTELVRLEEHRTFSGASQRARALATQHKQQTIVRRNTTGWEVLVPCHLKNVARRPDDDDCEPSDSGYDHDDEREQLIEELDGDRESWARSEEDGWYYGDDD